MLCYIDKSPTVHHQPALCTNGLLCAPWCTRGPMHTFSCTMGRYVVHYLNSTGLCFEPPTCIVHHWPALCIMVHKGDLCTLFILGGFPDWESNPRPWSQAPTCQLYMTNAHFIRALRMCCSFYQHLPMIKSGPTRYHNLTTSLLCAMVHQTQHMKLQHCSYMTHWKVQHFLWQINIFIVKFRSVLLTKKCRQKISDFFMPCQTCFMKLV